MTEGGGNDDQAVQRAVGAGTVLALATTIPAAMAYEVDAAHHSTSSMSAQRLAALEAQAKVDAVGYALAKAWARELHAHANYHGWVK
jgi:hypothetical protein